jgi:hypothetical protein
MKLSEVHQDLMDKYYPEGYVVPAGESDHFHIMYVDIMRNKGGRSFDKPCLQKYMAKEWAQTLKVIENPVYGIKITGHNEYFVLHDPLAEAQAKAQAKKELVEAKAAKYAEAQAKKKAEADATANTAAAETKAGS